MCLAGRCRFHAARVEARRTSIAVTRLPLYSVLRCLCRSLLLLLLEHLIRCSRLCRIALHLLPTSALCSLFPHLTPSHPSPPFFRHVLLECALTVQLSRDAFVGPRLQGPFLFLFCLTHQSSSGGLSGLPTWAVAVHKRRTRRTLSMDIRQQGSYPLSQPLAHGGCSKRSVHRHQ